MLCSIKFMKKLRFTFLLYIKSHVTLFRNDPEYIWVLDVLGMLFSQWFLASEKLNLIGMDELGDSRWQVQRRWLWEPKAYSDTLQTVILHRAHICLVNYLKIMLFSQKIHGNNLDQEYATSYWVQSFLTTFTKKQMNKY